MRIILEKQKINFIAEGKESFEAGGGGKISLEEKNPFASRRQKN